MFGSFSLYELSNYSITFDAPQPKTIPPANNTINNIQLAWLDDDALTLIDSGEANTPLHDGGPPLLNTMDPQITTTGP
ncbi:hypothetical protein JNB11_07325 [Kocuria palustris]|nr:hypothetical protein [Kocuria palustris]